MIRLVELVLYGVRQFQTLTRISFGPGLNVLSGGIGTGKSTIWELVVVMLLPDRIAQFRSFRHPHHTEKAQAALIFQTEDGARYRLLRDFVSERIQLVKLDPPGQTSATAAAPLATDAPSVEAELQRLRRGLTAEQIDGRWLLSHTRLPSSISPGGNGTAAPVVVGISPTTRSPAAPKPSAPPASNRTRLEELKRALAKAEEVSSLEEKVMAAQDRAVAIKQILTTAAQLDEDVAAAKAQAEGCAGFGQLPADYPVLIEGLTERERALQTQLNALHEQQQTLEEERAPLPSAPLFQQLWFRIGAGLIGVAILIVVFIRFLPEPFQYLFLGLLVAGFGIVVWSVVSDIKTQTVRKELDKKLKTLAMERESAEKRFAREQRPALDLLAHTGCNTITVFQERIRTYRQLLDEVARLQEEQTRHLNGRTTEQLEHDYQQAVDDGKALETQMRDAAATAGDMASLQTEIARLESMTTWGGVADDPGPPMATESPVTHSAPGPTVTGSGSTSWIDVIRAHWPHQDPALHAVVSTLFGTLSGGDDTTVAWTDGRLRIETRDRQPIDPDLLSTGQRDALLLACFLAPWLPSQAGNNGEPSPRAQTGQFPLLLDEPFLSLDATGQSACLQWLRAIGATQQILLATRLTVAEQPGDHRLTLPLVPAAAKEPMGR